MEQLILWMLMAYGMTSILVWGSIFQEPRDLIRIMGETKTGIISDISKFISDLISCVLCTSTWVGFFFSMTIYSPSHEFLGVNTWGSWFFDGMFTAGSVWAINAIIEWFEENRPK